MQKDWKGVIVSGLEMLKLNPWDLPIAQSHGQRLRAIAIRRSASWPISKLALDVDIEGRRGQPAAMPGPRPAGRISTKRSSAGPRQESNPSRRRGGRAQSRNLTVQKTIHRGGYEEAESSTEVMADKDAQAERQGTAGTKLTPEQSSKRRSPRDPEKVDNYSELADLHLRHDRLEQAEEVLAKALSVSGGESGCANGWRTCNYAGLGASLEIVAEQEGPSREEPKRRSNCGGR